jgi:hypothetical protein
MYGCIFHSSSVWYNFCNVFFRNNLRATADYSLINTDLRHSLPRLVCSISLAAFFQRTHMWPTRLQMPSLSSFQLLISWVSRRHRHVLSISWDKPGNNCRIGERELWEINACLLRYLAYISLSYLMCLAALVGNTPETRVGLTKSWCSLAWKMLRNIHSLVTEHNVMKHFHRLRVTEISNFLCIYRCFSCASFFII